MLADTHRFVFHLFSSVKVMLFLSEKCSKIGPHVFNIHATYSYQHFYQCWTKEKSVETPFLAYNLNTVWNLPCRSTVMKMTVPTLFIAIIFSYIIIQTKRVLWNHVSVFTVWSLNLEANIQTICEKGIDGWNGCGLLRILLLYH